MMYSGETMMKIGLIVSGLMVIIFLIFYRNDINPEIRISVYGVVVILWMTSSVVYGGAKKKINELNKRIKELESKN